MNASRPKHLNEEELERLLNEEEFCCVTGKSKATAQRDRILKTGCPYVKVGALVLYRPTDVRAYID